MRRSGFLALVFLTVLSVALPAGAQVAAIETTAPLADHSEQAIEAAFRQAVETAVRGAMAMGLPWLKVRQARVLADMVTILVLASDVELEADEEAQPGGGASESEPIRPAALDI